MPNELSDEEREELKRLRELQALLKKISDAEVARRTEEGIARQEAEIARQEAEIALEAEIARLTE